MEESLEEGFIRLLGDTLADSGGVFPNGCGHSVVEFLCLSLSDQFPSVSVVENKSEKGLGIERRF